MSRYFVLFMLLLGAGLSAAGQYTAQGKIEFERRVNIHRQMEDMDDDGNGWFQKIKAQVPKFTTSYFNYYFTEDKAVYKPGKETENPFKMFGGAPASENVVYTDFNNRKVAALKQIYEEKFLVQDSMRRLEWKIMDEIRTIAGYKCRKAVGRICDSVYVVAFYSEDILASGGPEMFSGLPGMILEIAIPRLYSTWTAASVDITPPKPDNLLAPEKGKKTTQHELYTTLQSSMSRWGKYAQRSIWWSML